MLGWIILIIYIIGVMGFSVTITRWFILNMLDNETVHEADNVDKVMGTVLGFLCAFFWPLVIPCGWVYQRVFRPRCVSMLYIEGSTVPDRILKCSQYLGHKTAHRRFFTTWTDEEEWKGDH